MPAEVERLRRRLGRRDLVFLAAVALALLVAVPVALLVRGQRAAGPTGPCVRYSHPNFTGGATYSYCGVAARRFCRSPAAASAGVLPDCERLGLRARRPAPELSRPRPRAAG